MQEEGELETEVHRLGSLKSASCSSGPRFMMLAIVFPMVLIVIGEAFFFLRQLEVPLVLHGLNLLYCIVMPLVLGVPPGILQAFSLVSVLRMMNIGMPVFFDFTVYWLPFVYAPVIVVAVLVARYGGEKTTILGVVRGFLGKIADPPRFHMVLYIALALGLGAILGFIEYHLLRPERLVPNLSFESMLLLFAVMVLFVGLGEELVFRYLLQDRMKTKIGVIAAILLTSFVFAIMHSGYSNLFYIVYVFMIGMVFGVSYEWTRSLAFVALLHGAINFFLFSVFP